MMKFKALAVMLVAIVAVFAFSAKAEVLTFGTTTLKVGSSGMYVTNLQTVLNTYSAAGLKADGAFGPKTDSAVKIFQAAQGLTADGLVGAKTKEKLEMVQGGMVTGGTATCPAGYTCTATGTGSTGSFVINGSAGSIDEVDELGTYNGEEVGEDEADVKILAANVTASDDSDLQLTAVKVSFEESSAVTVPEADRDFDEYAESVSVMLGGEEVASIDVSDFNENNNVWSKTITLDSSAIIEAGDDMDLILAVTAMSNIDSSDLDNDNWSASIEEIRYRDQTGQVFTDSTTGDLPAVSADFDFASFASANDIEMKVSLHDDSPEASSLNLDDQDDTDGVTLAMGEIEADGSDLVFESIPVFFQTSESDIDNVINSVTLSIDGEDYTETVSTATLQSTTITFDDLDLTVEDGDTVDFTVTADFNDIEASSFDEGTTISAQVTGTNVDAIEVEDEDGEQLDTSDMTGSAIGETQTAYSSGIIATFVSASETVTTGTGSNDDIATFTITFEVEAFDDDVFIPDTASNAATTHIDFTVDKAGTELSAAQYGSAVTATVVNNDDDDVSTGGYFDISDGDKEELTLTISMANSGSVGAGLFRAAINNIRWNVDDTTAFNSYTFNLDSFKTDYISVN